MPKVVSGVLDLFADHAIDVPVPANSARHGVPNACGVCHRDRSALALAAAVAAKWPSSATRQARRARLADAFDEATAAASLGPLLAVIGDNDEAPTLRGAAAVLLAQRFRARADALVPLLQSSETLLRAKACEALAVAGARAAADALAARSDDRALIVRQAAALALSALGDGRAEAALRALADGPASAHLMQPHFALARLLARRGELDGARRELEIVARLTPYHADALAFLAEVQARRGDLAAARARVDEALRFDATNRLALALRDRLPRW